jgi:hypothetical protein
LRGFLLPSIDQSFIQVVLDKGTWEQALDQRLVQIKLHRMEAGALEDIQHLKELEGPKYTNLTPLL